MRKILGEDIECPFCGKLFLEGDEVELITRGNKLLLYCSGCGMNLEVELHDDDKIYI